MDKLKAKTVALLMALAAPLASGCYVEEQVGPPVVVGGYAPQYYDGYVVYYDDFGRPYYHANGAVVWISPTVPAYGGLVAHWRAYAPAYRSWYVNYGYRYRAYRVYRR